MSDVSKKIAYNIKQKIASSGLTQVEIVEKMNRLGCKVNQGQISKWSNGTAMPRVNTCDVLAKVLHCELKDLLDI